MYVPILIGALSSSVETSFSERELTIKLSEYMSAHVPPSVVLTIANRCVRRGFLKRDAGRWLLTKATPLESEKKLSIEKNWSIFITTFIDFASSHGVSISVEDSEQLLLGAIKENKAGLVFDAENTKEKALSAHSAALGRAVVGKFFAEQVSGSRHLQDAVVSIVAGLVLRSTLFLGDTIAGPKRLDQLTAFLDSKLAFGLLGVGDDYECNAVQQGVLLIRRNGITLRVFDKTLDEMRRVLDIYKNHLGTAQGIRSLHNTRLTSYFLRKKWSPGDVAELSVLLEKKLREYGISVFRTPDRVASSTLGEVALEEKLASSGAGTRTIEKRVVHDVDCIAAVLTLRRGRVRDRLEDSSYIFSTLGWMTAKNIHDWYREQGGKGYAPCVHQSVLTTLSWMHSPSAGEQWLRAGIGSIAAFSSVVSEKAWSKFKGHLRKLGEEGSISTDEELFLLASRFAESSILEEAVSRGDDPDEPDATTIAEAVERVRRQEHEHVMKVESDLGSLRTANAIRDARRIRLARQIGVFFSWLIAVVLLAISIFGLIFSFPNAETSMFKWSAVALYGVLALCVTVFGADVKGWRRALGDWFADGVLKILP